VGGGFGGASAARALKKLDPRIGVTLVEASHTFTACPFSNNVIAGLRDLKQQQFDYKNLEKTGLEVTFEPATRIDAEARTVIIGDAGRLPYDRLVLAPGIDIRWDG